MSGLKVTSAYPTVNDFEQLQFHYSQKSGELERVKRIAERLLSNALLIEKARYVMALGEQSQMDLLKAEPKLFDELEQGIESGEIPPNL